MYSNLPSYKMNNIYISTRAAQTIPPRPRFQKQSFYTVTLITSKGSRCSPAACPQARSMDLTRRCLARGLLSAPAAAHRAVRARWIRRAASRFGPEATYAATIISAFVLAPLRASGTRFLPSCRASAAEAAPHPSPQATTTRSTYHRRAAASPRDLRRASPRPSPARARVRAARESPRRVLRPCPQRATARIRPSRLREEIGSPATESPRRPFPPQPSSRRTSLAALPSRGQPS